MDKNLIIIASATMGLESLIKNECEELGFKNINTFNGRVEFTGSLRDIAKANINLRCADRVFLKMGEFNATTFEELFQNIKKLPWNNLIPENGEFKISWVSSVKSKLFSKSDIQKISKKAIVENMKLKYEKEVFSEDGPVFSVKIQAQKDIFLVMIDTSGTPLHKRGYRFLHNEAPIKETMAAALVKIAKWKGGNRPLVDFMCGTGTIGIEAALIARNIAPGVNRRFISETWPVFDENVGDENVWIDERDKAFSNEDNEKEVNIFLSDIDEDSIAVAKENIKKIGLEDDISVELKDFKDVKIPDKTGAIITNPPYGDRMLDANEVFLLYRKLGEACRENFKKWSYYIITSYEDFEKDFGKKATKNRKLYNGGIKCYFYQYYGEDKVK